MHKDHVYPENSDFELRYFTLQMRASGDENAPKIEGDGAVFDIETVIGGWFREKIRPGAFTRVLSENPDVIGAYNHNWDYVLGRTTAGTMTLEQTDAGLRYAIDINPKDTQAMSVYEKVRRGDVNQSSFVFTVRKEEWTEPEENSAQLDLREIVEIGKLYEVGPVPFAQYPEASAQARSMAEKFLQERSRQAAPGGAEGLEARQKARIRRIEIAEKSFK